MFRGPPRGPTRQLEGNETEALTDRWLPVLFPVHLISFHCASIKESKALKIYH